MRPAIRSSSSTIRTRTGEWCQPEDERGMNGAAPDRRRPVWELSALGVVLRADRPEPPVQPDVHDRPVRRVHLDVVGRAVLAVELDRTGPAGAQVPDGGAPRLVGLRAVDLRILAA